jgi:hypothetical protein
MLNLKTKIGENNLAIPEKPQINSTNINRKNCNELDKTLGELGDANKKIYTIF